VLADWKIETRSPWRFDHGAGRWVEDDSGPSDVEADRITLATFNIWFSSFHRRERLEALLGEVRKHEADFIGLQEVMPETLDSLLRVDWIREGYRLSDASGDTVNPYGSVLLSRFPVGAIVVHHLPSLMGRKLIVGQLGIGGEEVQVATVHLESTRPEAEARGDQLAMIQPILRRDAHAVLMGDFNFCATWEEENCRIGRDFVDLWSVLRPDDPGWTEDGISNPMGRRARDPDRRVRFDRILLRSSEGRWRGASMELLGTKPIDPGRPDVFPSDHFGLVAKIVRAPTGRQEGER
jgi:tyrosyl-DNA phosphodiesterase 2